MEGRHEVSERLKHIGAGWMVSRVMIRKEMSYPRAEEVLLLEFNHIITLPFYPVPQTLIALPISSFSKSS